ncbi:STAS-like domain-containing protein [Pseudomonas sp. BJa5]|uniref:STAS-like domain-containing protein n=1 Tax=Pseudomonas sp. BJa5 TaxID=2936270 RepID=UPI002559F518|nr:STAS-like domain-containing protein [Pseudomonas sp. BGr12]MDL2422486.1 STAS-like domain-containing protein [Pseudomonas sp. BGr12]
MTSKPFKITVVDDFSKAPYGRYPADSEFCGENFRKRILAPRLREYDRVHVILDGYNRYGRSFLDEAFGGLIREEGFTAAELEKKLTYSHSLIKSIEKVIAERIDAAEKSRQ